jgi:uncharacterized RDD family membrane protein YckC
VYVPQNAQPPETIPAIPQSPATQGRPVYAGFWLRAVAYLVDSIIISIPFGLIAGIYPSVFFISTDANAASSKFPFPQYTPFAVGIVLAVFLLYSALFESSSWQATPGKRIVRVYVTDLNGRPITLARALLRNAAKVVSGLVFVGYFIAGFTEKKQALHDMLASCLVLRRP